MLLAAAMAKACALLTAAEIAGAQGEEPVKARESKPLADTARCLYTLPTAARLVQVEVTRGARVGELAERLRLAAQTEGMESSEHDAPAVEAVAGLGEEAWWAEGVRQGALYVRRGATLLRIALGGDDGKEAKLAKLRVLAGKALARLEQ